MDYVEEVAVLLGAFSLLEYKHGADELKVLRKDECSEAVEILSCAIDEILGGLNKIPDNNHIAEWKQKVTSLLLHGLLQCHRCNCSCTTPVLAEEETSYDRIASALPSFSCHLYFNIIEQLSFTPELWKAVAMVDPVHIQWLALCILQHINQQTNPKDLQLFADFCEFLTDCPSAILCNDTTELNNPNRSEDQDEFQADYHEEIQELFCDILRRNMLHFTSDSQKKSIFGSMMQLTSGVYLEKFSIDEHILNFSSDDSTCHRRQFNPRQCKNNQHFQNSILSILASYISHDDWTKSIKRFFKIFTNFQSCLMTKHEANGAGNLNETARDLCGFTYKLYLCEATLRENNKFLPSQNDTSGAYDSVNLEQEQVLAFLDGLQLKELLDLQREIEIEQRKRVYSLEIAIRELAEKSEHHQDYLDWLLRQRGHIVEDERYVKCLLENICLLASEDRFYALLDVLMETAKDDTAALLKEVCLVVLRELPLTTQNHLHGNLPEKYTTLLAKCMDEPFQQQVIQVLNQLVNNAEEIEESVRGLSPLALQCPADVVNMALSESITNSGQNGIIVEVFRMLPNICITLKKNKPRIGRILHDVISKKKKFSCTEVQNLLDLIRGLLENFMYDSATMSLLNPSEFIKLCIVEHLSWGTVNDGNTLKNSYLELALKMLLVAIETNCESDLTPVDVHTGNDPSVARKTHWIFTIDLIPLLQTLCGLLDGCRFLWFEPSEDSDADNTEDLGSRVIVKTLTIEIIERICQIVELHPSETSEKSLMWLYNCIRDFDWSTRLHLHKLFSTSPHTMTVPGNLADYCTCTTDDSRWALDTHDKTDGLLVMLQVGSNNDVMMNTVLDDLMEGEILEKDGQLYGNLVLALAQLLPQCIQSELQRMMRIVQQIIKRCPSSFKYRTLYTNNLPLDVLHEDCLEGLMVCQVLCDTLYLLKHTLWMSDKIWNHVAKSFSLTMQNVLSNCTVTKRTGYMEHQMFCHTCSAVPLLPELAQEHVYLLLMDLLSNYLQYKARNNINYHMQCCIETLPKSQYKDNLMKQWNC
ncbi:unnamed protein product [Owenia fusiformis]|uniref:Uncharacterized protein n=1 Tax=Owenia fusiformis TaxID=6347 RepID=A0A8J1UDF9_OWEFU|nr:unnamed protein product [Owenia fusiformis]